MTGAAATLLAFDYGERRIGVAVGQTVSGTASPLGIVRVGERGPDWEAIGALMGEWSPDALVVGLPLELDGAEQPVTRLARRFARQLAGRYHLRVHMADERLSTREARSRMSERARDGEEDDSVAAQVILETWLECRRTAS